MLDVHEHLPRSRDVRIGHQAVDRVNRRGWNACGQHFFDDLVDIVRRCPFLENKLNVRVARDTLRISVEF